MSTSSFGIPSAVLAVVRPDASAWDVLLKEYEMFGAYERPSTKEDYEETFRPRRCYSRQEGLEGPDMRRVTSWKSYRCHQWR